MRRGVHIPTPGDVVLHGSSCHPYSMTPQLNPAFSVRSSRRESTLTVPCQKNRRRGRGGTAGLLINNSAVVSREKHMQPIRLIVSGFVRSPFAAEVLLARD